MDILVTGASGLVGTALVRSLSGAGHRVRRLSRSEPRPGEDAIYWNPLGEPLAPEALTGVEAVVHLAGETIAQRWTPEVKAKIRDSRIRGTAMLCATLARMSTPPKVLVSASAIGYYGDRGDEVLTETSAPGKGFLAEVCQAWEAATSPAADRGIRVVPLRFGVILSTAGGALAKMLPPFRLGMGGVLGSGRQYMSWIVLDDAVGAIQHVLQTESLQGPTNAVSSHAVTNQEFTKTLGTVLRRPTVLPMPAFAVRLMFGEMADELLLASTRVQPAKLDASGYRPRYPDLMAALRYLLGQ